MKMAMTTDLSFGEAETQRQRDVLTQRDRTFSTKSYRQLGRQLVTELRRSLLCLAGVGLVVLLFANRTKIVSISQQKMAGATTHVQDKAGKSPLRQQALDYEREVDAIAAR